MFDKFKELMEMKKQADRIKKELDSLCVDVEAVKGIKIRISGAQNFRSLQIEPDLLNAQNHLKLQEDLLKSINAAITQSQQAAAQKMKNDMPGMPGF